MVLFLAKRMMEFFQVKSEEEFYNDALGEIVREIRECLNMHKDCRVGLAGGKTPEKLFQLLSNLNLPWDRIKFIQIDERRVLPDHEESNQRMIRKNLTDKISMPDENFIYFDTGRPEEEAIQLMNKKIAQLAHEKTPIFDVLILGAGDDGHIASLFEGDAAMTSAEYATSARAENYKTKERLTLTLKALSSCQNAYLLLKHKPVLVDELLNKKGLLKLTALNYLKDKVELKVICLQ